MKILIAHNFYQRPGGEDDVVRNESDLLTTHGHEVKVHSVTNDDIQSTADKIRTAWTVTYSHDARRRIARDIADFSPDVVHVHNFFPLLSPSIYDACQDAGVAVVQTLHNYRLICASGQLTRNATPCEKCIHGKHAWGVIHRCYRDSVLASLAVARMISTHRRRDTWARKVHCFITPSHFMKQKFVEARFPAEQIHVKPNFVPEFHGLSRPDPDAPRHGALFAARLSPEKGVRTLMTVWQGLGVDLRVVGDGPLMAFVQGAADSSTTLLGWLPLPELIAEMRRAQFLLMPSTWYEGFPVTLALSFACGLPVIASRLGALAEIVEDGKTGLHFTPGDAAELAAKVRWAVENPERMREMGRTARLVYKRMFSPERNYEMLLQIYQAALERRDAARDGVHASPGNPVSLSAS